ncbi:hypothetical protein [Sorangium sp. So ce1153]|uniref:hypothetical protein n=1 Tax=Sorangium sp. So ce1153 TaxID=3133333 RepID=UPI003F63CDA7
MAVYLVELGAVTGELLVRGLGATTRSTRERALALRRTPASSGRSARIDRHVGR